MSRNPDAVAVELDRERYLAVDFNMIEALYEHTGVNLMAPSEEDLARLDRPDPKLFKVMIWGALLSDDPELKLSDVGALLTPSSIGKLSEALGEAMSKGSLSDGQKKSSKKKPEKVKAEELEAA